MNKIHALTTLAELYMARSRDPIHDTEHVDRVAGYARRIAANYDLSKREMNALMLAVHWHDVSRSILPKTSFIWMYFFDDLLSSLMLWFWTIRYGLFGSVAGMSTRIILCKSKPLGTLFVRVCLTKRTRLLLSILEDADALDMMHIERISRLCALSSAHKHHTYAYHIVSMWWTARDRMRLSTDAAKHILKELLRQFMIWVHSPVVIRFHESLFGQEKTRRLIDRWVRLAIIHH